MAKLIYSLKGVRGRDMDLYDTKIVITTNQTVGSFLTGNITDGKKTIFMCDIVGVQFKKSGRLIGYLQMNNKNDNMFSENTFTYENGKNGITNELMEKIYSYVVDRVEEIKYNTAIICETPNFKCEEKHQDEVRRTAEGYSRLKDAANQISHSTAKRCPYCGEIVKSKKCEMCGKEINY